MPQTFKIDQAATFAACVLLSSEAKLAFGSDRQDTTKDGTPKWECQVVAGFRQFGRTVNEVLKVGIVSYANPADQVQPYTPVQLVGLEVGVMERTGKNGESAGFSVWYRADELRSIADTRPVRTASKSDGEAA
jgi:hypothetical protein